MGAGAGAVLILVYLQCGYDLHLIVVIAAGCSILQYEIVMLGDWLFPKKKIVVNMSMTDE